VFLDTNLNGILDDSEQRTTTDSQGRYLFRDLYPGPYSVRVVLPATWEQISPQPPLGQTIGPFATRVAGGFDASYTDFGVIQAAYVSGKVFDDKNRDGIHSSATEPGLNQWLVYIDLNGNGASDLGEPGAYTDSTGGFRLRSPQSGVFRVEVYRYSGWQSTVPADGSRQVTLVPGNEVTGQNFGLTQGPLNNAGFKNPVNYPSGTGDFSNPVSVATGDFNGDGHVDFVSANNASDVTVYLNDGVGIFSSASAGFAGASLQQLITVDLNHDQTLDLVTVNQDTDDISVLLGHGDGTFSTSVNYPTAIAPQSAVGADFNGDGSIDLAVAGRFSDQLSLLSGNGDGTFDPPTDVPNVNGAAFLAVGDVNGDGKTDIVSANEASANVSVLLGKGDGTFQAPSLLTAGIVNPISLALADLNDDQNLDLVVVNTFSDSVQIITGRGNGLFDAAGSFGVGSLPVHVAIGDIDADQKPDLAIASFSDGTTDISGGINILRNLGNGVFDGPLTSTAHTSPAAVALADFNGDSLLDLTAANFFSDDVSVMINSRATPARVITGRIFADFNGDGLQNANETGVGQRTVFADLDLDGLFDSGEPSATTDQAGQFVLPPLPADVYVVRQVLFGDWIQSWPHGLSGHIVDLTRAVAPDLLFGIRGTQAPEVLQAIVGQSGGTTIELLLSRSAGNSLSGTDLVVTDVTTGQVISQVAVSQVALGQLERAVFRFPGYAMGILPDGNYLARLPSGAIADSFGNALAGDVLLSFFVFNARAFAGELLNLQNPAAAIDALFAEVRAGSHSQSLDLTNDGLVDEQDVDFLVETVLATDYGDVNLDGLFNSSDLVLVFQQGKYEQGVAGDAGWADGDWNGDGLFDSSDLVKAFQAGAYEQGARRLRRPPT
jgi:hypothetical protein